MAVSKHWKYNPQNRALVMRTRKWDPIHRNSRMDCELGWAFGRKLVVEMPGPGLHQGSEKWNS